MNKINIFLVSLFLLLSFQVRAQPGVWFDVPVYDYPFNQSTSLGLDYFSMRQSVALSTGFSQTVHRAIAGDTKKGRDGGIFFSQELLTIFLRLFRWDQVGPMKNGIGP